SFNEKAFLFGDDSWKMKNKEMEEQLDIMKKVVPGPIALNDMNSLTAEEWKAVWELDKAAVDYALNAIERYMEKDDFPSAVKILDDPYARAVPGARTLRSKIGDNSAVKKQDDLSDYLADGDKYFERQDYYN